MKTQLRISILLILVCNILFAQRNLNDRLKLSGHYLGQKPPGTTPELFAPGIICTGFNERDVIISPDGKEIYYGLLTGRHITIMQTKLVSGQWTEPEVAPFAADDRYFHLEPCFSIDGKSIFFLSTRPPGGKEPKPRWAYQNIWASDRQSDGSWSEPYMADTAVINKNNVQFYPSMTNDNTMYFTTTDPKNKKSVIVRSRFIGGKYQEAEKLPAVINQEGTSIYNAFISPDEKYLIACVDGKPNEMNPGFANYYLFFRDTNDRWGEGISFGPEVNIKGSTAMSASVSPDGKYLFFAAQKVSKKLEETYKRKTLGNMTAFLSKPQNGNYDIYWVSAEIIEDMKPKNRQ